MKIRNAVVKVTEIIAECTGKKLRTELIKDLENIYLATNISNEHKDRAAFRYFFFSKKAKKSEKRFIYKNLLGLFSRKLR